MMRLLPKPIRGALLFYREELTDLIASLKRERPFSREMMRDQLAELLREMDTLETAFLEALDADPNYDPAPWGPDDYVILTTRTPESEGP